MLRRAGRPSALSCLFAGATLALVLPATATGTVPHPHPAPAHGSGGGVRPGPLGELDCNGFSPVQRPVKPGLVCADPRGPYGGRFLDNGHYIGHDEPSVRFLSSRPGSGGNFSITETLPTDPAAPPTVRSPGADVTHWFELTSAPWFSIDLCDPNSAPLLPCTPGSDANAPRGSYPGGGAAFVELQFYPPGFAPFLDATSCDNTHWCSALNIDSLECQGNGSGHCNPRCPEPVNFAFIQANGVPTGPPSPQKADVATFSANSRTLLMNPGDKINVHMWDAKIPGGHALEARIADLTTGHGGFVIASGKNGFFHTNPFTCNGTPFNFQPEYSTARPGNVLPWGTGPYMINSEFEIGHWEACTSVSGRGVFNFGGGFKDTYYKHCAGPYETTPDGPAVFERSDLPCYKKGDTHSGHAPPDLATGCNVFAGDLEYDGSPYWADWPHALSAGPFPSPFLQRQPTSGGRRYSRIQFVTTTSATEFNTGCNLVTGAGCVLPPKGPGHFFPFFSLAKVGGLCVWEFGNMSNGRSFGGPRQYGKVGPGTIGAFASRARRNPPC